MSKSFKELEKMKDIMVLFAKIDHIKKLGESNEAYSELNDLKPLLKRILKDNREAIENDPILKDMVELLERRFSIED